MPRVSLYAGERDAARLSEFLADAQQALALVKNPTLYTATRAIQSCVDFSSPARAWVAIELEKNLDKAFKALPVDRRPADIPAEMHKPLPPTVLDGMMERFIRSCRHKFRDPTITCVESLSAVWMKPSETVETHNKHWATELASWPATELPSAAQQRKLYLLSLPRWLRGLATDLSGTVQDMMNRVSAIYNQYDDVYLVPLSTDRAAWAVERAARGPRNTARRGKLEAALLKLLDRIDTASTDDESDTEEEPDRRSRGQRGAPAPAAQPAAEMTAVVDLLARQTEQIAALTAALVDLRNARAHDYEDHGCNEAPAPHPPPPPPRRPARTAAAVVQQHQAEEQAAIDAARRQWDPYF